MSIEQNINSNNAQLAVTLTANVEWKLPAENVEEQMLRDKTEQAVAHLAYQFQDNVAHLLLTAIKIKSEG